MKVSSSLRQKWDNVGKDVVVLHMFQRAYTCPSISPFIIKLETYLRMNDIKYEPDFEKPMGPKGKSPWITFNGKDIADSQLSIETIMPELGKEIDPHLSVEDKAIARALMVTVEERLYWVMCLDVYKFDDNLAFVKEWCPPFPGVPGFLLGVFDQVVADSTR